MAAAFVAQRRVGRRWLPILAALPLVAAGGYMALRDPPLEPVEVLAADAHRTTVIQKVRAVGHVEPVTQVKVSSNVTGDLLALQVKEGDRVERGMPLAEIDRERLSAVVRQSEANVKSLAATVDLERAELAQAEAELKRTETLQGQALASQAELERARSQVLVVKARAEAAGQRVAQARAALDEAAEHLKKTRLFAPIDGTVISLNKKVGERIRGSELAEDVLLTIAPLHAMQVEVEVTERDVVRVALQQPAEIEIDALSDGPVPGRVVEIASSAVIKNRGTEMETTSFVVKVALDEIPEALRSGMSASVSIVTDLKNEVIAVPIESVTARLPSQLAERAEDAKKKPKKGAIDFAGDGPDAKRIGPREKPVDVVFAVENGKAEPKRVKIGISSDLEIEIVEGLTGGEEVIAGPYQLLARELLPGSPVNVQRKLPPPPPAGPVRPKEARATPAGDAER